MSENIIYCYSCEEELIKRIDSVIANQTKEGNAERVIISCADKLKSTAVKDKMLIDADGRNYVYKSNGKKIPVYSCSTSKGLEADEVLITDISDVIFEKGNCDFYVAASRAKKKLFIFIDREKVHLKQIIDNSFNDSFPFPDNEARLAVAMHGVPKK